MTQINPPHPVALRPGFAEALEARRLLAVSFDNALGILRITGDDANDIIQIQVTDVDNATNQPSSFTVFQSSSQAARPGTLPTQQQVIDYINSGGIAVPGQFQVSEVREMVIDSGNGDDLIILGRRLRIPARVDSGDGNDSVSGGLSDDTITGNQGTDYVFGGFGDDNLSGGTGSDEIFGGTGDDSVDYKLRTAALNITLDNAGGDAESGENDNVRSDIEIVIGGLGNDVISANASPSPVTLFGGAGDDSLTGSGFDDELFGDAGNDSISGGGGNDGLFDEDDESDTLDGGAGDDFAVANAHGDEHDDTFTSIEQIFAQENADTDPPLASGGSATLGGDGTLTVTGTGGDDVIELQVAQDGQSFFVLENSFTSEFELADVQRIVVTLGGGDNLFFGGGVNKTIDVTGGSGRDLIAGGTAADTLRGGGGDDILLGRAGNDVLDGGTGGDYFSGGAGNDTADYSSRTVDVLAGIGSVPDDGERGEGDNLQTDLEILQGGTGNDRLNTQGDTGVTFIGNAGRDIINGGPGADSYFVQDGEIDTVRGGGGGDVVGDADADDDIDSLGD